MASVRKQALIEAPVKRVWELLGNPESYPEWAGDTVEVTGVPTQVEKGATYEQRTIGPFGRPSPSTFVIEEMEDMHEIKLRCQTSGYYSHWHLTEAQGQTFADVEIGVEPIGIPGQMARFLITRSQLRQVTDESLDGLRRVSTGGRGDDRE
jgi:uncharacterized protein YndB with AHSA1/START domain